MSKYLVFGHKNPDTDAIASAIAFSFYLEKIGNEAEGVALGSLNEETLFALNYFNCESPRVVETVANEVAQVALVDHNESIQSVSDLSEVQVDYVVDHHRIGDFETAHPVFYRAEPIGSTSSILYKLFRENQIDIPQAIAGLMLSAVISDTLLLKSPTTTKEDIEIAYELTQIAGVNLEEYGTQLLKAGTDISQKTAEQIAEGDAKSFEMNGQVVRIGQINSVGFEDVLSRKADLLEVMQEVLDQGDFAVYLLVVTDIISNDSIGLVLGKEAAKVEAAFNGSIVDDVIPLPGVVSRKKQIVPPLTLAFEA